MAKNFARMRGVNIVFSNKVLKKKIKMEIIIEEYLAKKLTIGKNLSLWVFKGGYTVKKSVDVVAEGKTKLKD